VELAQALISAAFERTGSSNIELFLGNLLNPDGEKGE
jgi:hypothetical protein